MALIPTEDLVDGIIRNCDEDRCAHIASSIAGIITDKPISDVLMGLALITNDVCEKMADAEFSIEDIRKAFFSLVADTTSMSAVAKLLEDLDAKNWKK